jgi:hypothetical protein
MTTRKKQKRKRRERKLSSGKGGLWEVWKKFVGEIGVWHSGPSMRSKRRWVVREMKRQNCDWKWYLYVVELEVVLVFSET